LTDRRGSCAAPIQSRVPAHEPSWAGTILLEHARTSVNCCATHRSQQLAIFSEGPTHSNACSHPSLIRKLDTAFFPLQAVEQPKAFARAGVFAPTSSPRSGPTFHLGTFQPLAMERQPAKFVGSGEASTAKRSCIRCFRQGRLNGVVLEPCKMPLTSRAGSGAIFGPARVLKDKDLSEGANDG